MTFLRNFRNKYYVFEFMCRGRAAESPAFAGPSGRAWFLALQVLRWNCWMALSRDPHRRNNRPANLLLDVVALTQLGNHREEL